MDKQPNEQRPLCMYIITMTTFSYPNLSICPAAAAAAAAATAAWLSGEDGGVCMGGPVEAAITEPEPTLLKPGE